MLSWFRRVENKIDQAVQLLKTLVTKENDMAKTLDDLAADAAALKTATDKLIALNGSIAEQLKAAKGDQSKIDAIAAVLEGETAAVQAALPAADAPA